MSKINIFDIVRDHFNSLYNANTGKSGWGDWFTFLILPILIALFFLCIGFDVNGDSIETIVGGLAIFVGLLFNALVMLLDIARKQRQDGKQIKIKIVKELTANISFSILVAFTTIFVILMGFIKSLPKYIQIGIDFVGFFLLAEFLLVFLMILKRTYLIFMKELIDM